MSASRGIDRRTLLRAGATAGGGLLLSIWLPGCRSRGAIARPPGPPFAPNLFLAIEPDDTVVVTVPRPEMGQGVRTGLALIVAAELDADWSRLRLVQADLDPRLGDQYAGGSNSTQDSWEPLRRAGAVARAMLLAAAARTWGVEAASCSTAAGRVAHAASDRSASYGELVGIARTLNPPPAESVTLRDPRQLPLVGRRIRQLDVPEIVTGQIRFGLDVRVPGMLFAVVERAPVFGGRVRRIDDGAARSAAGVRAVVAIDADALPDFGASNPKPANGVAVVANSTWAAIQARRRLTIAWEDGPGFEESTTRLRERCVELASLPPERIKRDDGDVAAALAAAARTLDVVYEQPLVAHAQLEPMSCTAACGADRCEVWAPTQDPAGAREVVQKITGLPAEAIVVHVVRMGGGFGRRFYHDAVAEAVLVSRAVGAPVQVVWTREDDMRHGFYRPGSYHRLRGGIDEQGRPVAWLAHIVNASRGEFLRWSLPATMTEFPAAADLGKFDYPVGLIPNLRLQGSKISTRIPRGQWRSIEDCTSAFFYESFIDELAHLAGADPLAYRLALLEPARTLPLDDDPAYTWQTGRLARVLRLAAEKAGWGTPLAAGHGRGIAGTFANEAYAAMVAEVEVSAAGALRVHRVVAAFDCGFVVHPAGVEAQVEGSIVFALAAALHQQITVERGAVVQGNFDDFPLLRIDECPRLEVHLVDGEGPPRGAGEGAVPPVAPALVNAIFAATGKRQRRLPLSGAALRG